MASSPDNPAAAIPPRPGSSPGAEISPQLEGVLRNLNVNLEDELTRYRRQRHGRVAPPPPPRRAAQRKTIELISVAADAADAPPSAVPPPPPPNPFLEQLEPEEDPVLSALEQLSKEEAQANPGTSREENGASLPVPAGEVPAEGYLESSEELIKSIAEDSAESVPEPYSPERKNNSLLKLAGLVFVVLGGIGVGFAITNPEQLQKMRSQILPSADPTETETAEQSSNEPSDEPSDEPAATAPDAVSTIDAPDGYKPPGPDLSTREFKELDEVQDLVTLDLDRTNGTPANPAQSPIPNTPAAPAATAPPAQSPTVAPAPPSTAPAAPTPAPTAAAPATATGSNFYVVTSYTGDASLNKARELVPDAFVRNFKAGAQIQLAAFDNRAQAEDQVAALNQQGATVELFGPTNE